MVAMLDPPSEEQKSRIHAMFQSVEVLELEVSPLLS